MSAVLATAAAGALAAAPPASAALDPVSGTVLAAPGLGPVPVTVPAGYCAATFAAVGGAGDDPAALRGPEFGVLDVSAGDQFLLVPGVAGSPAGAPSEVLTPGSPPEVLLSTAGTTAGGADAAEPRGSVSYVFLPCLTPRSPNLQSVTPAGADALSLRFLPSPHEPGSGMDRVTGYEVSTDGGDTWAEVVPWQEDGDDALHATVEGLPRAVYSVGVRAVSGTGPSPTEAQDFLTSSLLLHLGTPSGVTATADTSSIHVGWSPPADAAGITGYRVEAVPDGPGTPAVCEVAATVHACRLGVPAGTSYGVVVTAVGPTGQYETVPSVAVPSGVVPGPVVAPAVPPSSGSLDAAASSTPGGSLAVRGAGFLPNSTVTLVVYSTPTVLGTVVTDATGAFATTVALPAGLAAGTHTLVASGVDAAGAPRHLVSALDVTGAAAASAPARPAPTTGGALALTGADVAEPALAGLAALVLGAGLTLAGRRRPAA